MTLAKIYQTVTDIVTSTYDQMYPEEAESARERGQRIRRTEERVIQEQPAYEKWIKKLKSKSDIEKYGIPIGAELVDNEDGYDEDEEVREPRSAKKITYDSGAIGGDRGLAGKTKFRLWLENVFLEHPKRKKLKSKIDGVSGTRKKYMMRTISYAVRRKIARDGLQPNATATFDEDDNTEEIHYNKSGKTWRNKR